MSVFDIDAIPGIDEPIAFKLNGKEYQAKATAAALDALSDDVGSQRAGTLINQLVALTGSPASDFDDVPFWKLAAAVKHVAEQVKIRAEGAVAEKNDSTPQTCGQSSPASNTATSSGSPEATIPES